MSKVVLLPAILLVEVVKKDAAGDFYEYINDEGYLALVVFFPRTH